MTDPKEMPLSLQSAFTFESMRRSIKGAEDLEALRKVALSVVDHMETQQRTVNQMLRQQWLSPQVSDAG